MPGSRKVKIIAHVPEVSDDLLRAVLREVGRQRSVTKDKLGYFYVDGVSISGYNCFDKRLGGHVEMILDEEKSSLAQDVLTKYGAIHVHDEKLYARV